MAIGGTCPYHWTLTFFGLQSDYRKTLHEEIFTLVYYGNGFSHDDIYTMPVYLRRFYSNALLDEKKREKEAMEKSNPSTTKDPNKIMEYKKQSRNWVIKHHNMYNFKMYNGRTTRDIRQT